MATIRKLNNRWQVQIRRKGFKKISKSFVKKADAQEWTRFKEGQADRSALEFDIQRLEHLTWGELLERYRDTVVSQKKCRVSETAHINAYLKRCQSTTQLTLSQIKSYHFSEYRDQRLKTVRPATICRELGIFHHAFEIAKIEWGLPISQNPVALVKKPKIFNRRERRLDMKEYLAILRATRECSNPYIRPIIQFAIYTGMRKGEILNIKQKHINVGKRTLFIPDTKTGYSRTIPLSIKALKVLVNTQRESDEYIFPITANALRLSWDRILIRTNVRFLTFHDLRHEAISRFFEQGLYAQEVALISGHRSYAMLARYTHPKAESIVKKI